MVRLKLTPEMLRRLTPENLRRVERMIDDELIAQARRELPPDLRDLIIPRRLVKLADTAPLPPL